MPRATAPQWLLILFLIGPSPTAAEAPADARAVIAAAQAEVRISEETVRRMRAELAALRADGSAAPETIAERERYLARLETQLEEDRRRLAALRSTHGQTPPPAPVVPATGPVPSVRASPVATEADEVAKMDERFQNSLRRFDDLLLQEARRAAERSAAEASGAGGGSAGAGSGRGGAESGQDGAAGEGQRGTDRPGQPGGEGSETRTARTGESSTEQREGVAASGRIDPTVSSGKGARTRGAGPSGRRIPPDIPDGRDDDIVARQIREAAENEDDPVLREKLWKEYREYKQGAS